MCLSLAALVFCSACSSPEPVAPQLLDTIEVMPVKVEATRGDVFYMDTRRATIVPEAYELSFSVSGSFEELYVSLGQSVSEGELIMKLDDSSIAQRIEKLEEEIEAQQASYAASNRKIEIKIEKAELQLQTLLDAQAAAEAVTHEIPTVSEDTTSSEDGTSSEDTTSSEESSSLEGAVSSEGTTSSEEETSSEEPSPTPEPTPTPPPAPAVDPYDIELKRLELRGYELELAQAQESQARVLKEKNALLAKYKLQQEEYYLYSPIDGQLVWLTSVTDPLLSTGSRISAESLVAIVVDPTVINLQTQRLDQPYLNRCDRMFAVINGKEYNITPLPNDAKEDSHRALEGKTLFTRFAVETTDDISNAGTAVICFQYNTATNVLTLPNGCTSYDIGDYVYRMNGTEREKVYIEIGMKGATCFEVISGLEEGDLIYAAS